VPIGGQNAGAAAGGGGGGGGEVEEPPPQLCISSMADRTRVHWMSDPRRKPRRAIECTCPPLPQFSTGHFNASRSSERGLHVEVKGSGPGGIAFATKLAKILRGVQGDSEIAAEQGAEAIEPQNLTFENAAEVARGGVRDVQ